MFKIWRASSYFVCYKYKMSASLSIEWIKQNLGFNTTADEYDPAVVTDSNGNIYMAYTTNGTVSGGTRIANGGSAVIAIAKFDANGTVIWLKQHPNLQGNTSNTPVIDTDNDGNLYISYVTSAAVSGGAILANGDIVVMKLNPNGDVQWVIQNPILNTSFADSPRSIKVVKSTGIVYISYIVGGAISGNTYMGQQDIVIAKILSDGTIAWVRQQTSLNTTTNDGSSGYDMTINQNEDILLAYTTLSAISGGTNYGSSDVVFARMNSTGDIIWLTQSVQLNNSLVQQAPHIVADNNYIYALYQTNSAVSGGTKIGNNDNVLAKLSVSDGSIIFLKENSTFNVSGVSINNAPVSLNFAPDGNLIAMVYTPASTAVFPGQIENSTANRITLIKFHKDTGNVLGLDQNPLLSPTTGSGPTFTFFRHQNFTVDYTGAYILAYQTNATTSGNTNIGDLGGNLSDIVIFKASGGVVEWTKQNIQLSTTGSDSNPVTQTDISGNIYIVYDTTGTVSGGGGKQGSTGANIVYAKLDPTGSIVWVYQNTNLNRNQLLSFTSSTPNIVMDPAFNGYFYISYYTTGTVSGAGNVNPAGATSTNSDIVIAKISGSTGQIMWIKQNPTFNTSGSDSVYSNRPVGMAYKFGTGLYCTYTVTAATSGNTLTGNTDICVMKIDPNTGATNWIIQNSLLNTTFTDATPSIALDMSENVYVAYQANAAVSGGTYTGGGDVVVAKINNSGVVQWIKQNNTFNSISIENIPSIAINSANEVIVAAHSGATISGGTFLGGRDICVWKMDSATGNTIWSKETPVMNGILNETNPTIACDSGDNIYIMYETAGTVSGGVSAGGTSDIVVTKMDTNGNVLEVNQYPALNSAGNETRPFFTLSASGTIVGTYITTGEIPGNLNVSRMRTDVVVGKAREIVAAPLVAPTVVRNGSEVTLSYTGEDAGTYPITYYKSIGGVKTALAGSTDTLAPGVSTSYYAAYSMWGNVYYSPESVAVIQITILIQAFSSKAGIYFSISNVPEGVTSIVISRDGSANPTIATLAAPIPSSYEDTDVTLGTTYNYTFTAHNADNTTSTVSVTASWSPSSYVFIPYGEVVIKAVSRTVDGLIQITYDSDIAGFYKVLFGDGSWIDTTCEILLEVGYNKTAVIASSDELDDGIYKIANTVVEADDNIIFVIATVDTNMVVPPIIVPYTGPSYVYPLYTIKTMIDGDRVAIVSPFKADYTGTTTADIGVIGMSDQQFFTGIDAVFEYTLTEEDAVRLLNSFNVRDTNVFPSPLYAVGQEGYTNEQDSLHFEVDLANKPVFKDVLRTIMAQAGQTTGKQLSNIKAYFEEEMRVELNLQLQQSGLLDMLEASNVSDVVVDLDISGGAHNMADVIDASGANANLKRKQFLTQIPLATLRSYMAEAQPFLGFLPLRGADSMTFVFDVNVDSPSELTAKADGSGATYADPAVVPSIHFDNERRQVAFIFHLTNRKSMFCPDVESVDTYMTDAILARFPDASGSSFTVDDVFYAARDFFELSPYVLRVNYTAADIARLDAAAAQPALTDATTPAEKRAVGLAQFKASAALEYKTQRDQATLVNTGIDSITNQGANSASVASAPLTVTYANNRITVSTADLSTIRLAPLYYYMVGDIEGTGPWQTMIPLTWAGTSLYADNVVFGSYGGFKIFGYFEPRVAPVMAPWMGPENEEVWVAGSANSTGAYLV